MPFPAFSSPAVWCRVFQSRVFSLPSVTIPEVIAEVKAVCAAEVADLSAPDDETVDLDLTAATLQH